MREVKQMERGMVKEGEGGREGGREGETGEGVGGRRREEGKDKRQGEGEERGRRRDNRKCVRLAP